MILNIRLRYGEFPVRPFSWVIFLISVRFKKKSVQSGAGCQLESSLDVLDAVNKVNSPTLTC